MKIIYDKKEERVINETDATENNPLNEDAEVNERVQALAKHLGIDASEIKPMSYSEYEFETDEGDYLVVDEHEARELAEEDIKNLFDDIGLDSFTPDFRGWIIRNALDNDFFEDYVRESYEGYADDIEDESDDTFPNRLVAEMYEANVLYDDAFKEDEDGEPIYNELNEDIDIEDFKTDFVEYLVEEAGDPVDYCGNNFGWDWVSDVATQHNLIDMDEVVEECIFQDGIAHFIARYDGEEIELEDGLFAYRTN